jgi:hypothetical protein
VVQDFKQYFFISSFLFANCTNASTSSKWCDGWRGRERGAHQHPSVIRGAILRLCFRNLRCWKGTVYFAVEMGQDTMANEYISSSIKIGSKIQKF